MTARTSSNPGPPSARSHRVVAGGEGSWFWDESGRRYLDFSSQLINGEEVVRPRLEKMRDRHPSVGEVRGLGLFWAVELVRDPETREMLVPDNSTGDAAKPMVEVAAACKDHGMWPFIHFNRVHIVPPCVISTEDLALGLDALDVAGRYC